jgi:hypothetical protein
MERHLVLVEGRYKAVEMSCVYSVEKASPVAGSVPEKQLTSSIGSASQMLQDSSEIAVVLVYGLWKAGGWCWLHVATGRSAAM